MDVRITGILILIMTGFCLFAGCNGTSPAPDAQNPPLTLSVTTVVIPAPGSTTALPVQPATPGKFLINFPWPAGDTRELTTGYHDHGALDFDRFTTGKAAVSAVAGGKVFLSDFSHPDSFNTYRNGEKGTEFADMGNFVILQHAPGTFTVYMHLLHEDPAPVTPGQEVPAGTRIGWQGNTGFSHGDHLHFAVVDVQVFPSPSFIGKPRESWGFIELNGTNEVVVNSRYVSQNAPPS